MIRQLNTEEIFKDIIGYEGLYKISNYGNVKSLPQRYKVKDEIILKPFYNSLGYQIIKLCKNSKTKSWRIHRLIAIHFIPNPSSLPHINHINGIKNDNRIENLEWCDHEHNMRHANRTGLITRRSKQYDSIRRPVIDTRTQKIYATASDAAKANGINPNTMRASLLRGMKRKPFPFAYVATPTTDNF